MTERAALELIDVRKAYGSSQALAGVDLTLRRGEVLGIAGPNGAGKSTLARLLAGEEEADSGEICWEGAPCRSADLRARVAIVHQEPELFPTLTVEANLMVGREQTHWRVPRVGSRELEVLGELGISPYAQRLAGDCSLAVRQLTTIAKALINEAELFLFDEPNSALTERQSVRLFSLMRSLADSGKLVVLVTHRLSELELYTDRVAVIFDGRCRREISGVDLTQSEIALELVRGIGHVAEARPGFGERPSVPEARLDVRLGTGSSEGGPSELTIRSGDIVALMGVEGAGARGFLRTLAGLTEGEAKAHYQESGGRRSFSYVGPDRRETLYHHLTVGENIVGRLGGGEIARAGLMRPRSMAAIARAAIERFRIRTFGPRQPLSALSGGNQQKVAIASAIASDPAVLLLEEPTRGVDVGSKADIYGFLYRFAEDGGAILLYCTEPLEAFEVAKKVIVFEANRIAREIQVSTCADVSALATAIVGPQPG